MEPIKETAGTWQVRLYNGPYLYDGPDESTARRVYRNFVKRVRSTYGRYSAKPLGLFHNYALVAETRQL